MTGKCAIAGMVCPETNDSSKKYFCPMWWETQFKNDLTGEVKFERSCGFTQTPQFLTHIAKLAGGAMDSHQQSRNEMDRLADNVRALTFVVAERDHRVFANQPPLANGHPPEARLVHQPDPGDVSEAGTGR